MKGRKEQTERGTANIRKKERKKWKKWVDEDLGVEEKGKRDGLMREERERERGFPT